MHLSDAVNSACLHFGPTQTAVQTEAKHAVNLLECCAGVVADLKQALPVAEESWEPYCWAHELYASPRMLLASLSRFDSVFITIISISPFPKKEVGLHVDFVIPRP